MNENTFFHSWQIKVWVCLALSVYSRRARARSLCCFCYCHCYCCVCGVRLALLVLLLSLLPVAFFVLCAIAYILFVHSFRICIRWICMMWGKSEQPQREWEKCNIDRPADGMWILRCVIVVRLTDEISEWKWAPQQCEVKRKNNKNVCECESAVSNQRQ